MVKISGILQNTLDSHPSYVEIKGTLVSGMGEGAYYMSLKGYTKTIQIKNWLCSFPGTLNVKIDKKIHQNVKQFETLDDVLKSSFQMEEKRTWIL